MTKGMRNKGGGVSNKENNKTMNANNTDNSQRNAKAGGASKSRSKEKQRIVEEEITKSAVPSLDETQANDVSSTAKKEHHKQVQPTSTQIMLAQLMGGENMDSMQKVKIKMVMDITGKMEDAVATALFDASWDESRAVELLLEDGDHLTAWEETGKKGKKKQKQSADDKEETEDLDEYNGQDFRENPGKRGPQRVRRGAGASQGGDRISSKNRAGDSNGSYEQGRDRDQVAASSGRGRIDQHPRRGGRGGGAISGGRSSYSGRGRRGGGGGIGRDGVGSNGSASANGNENVGGFSGSIDTWNPNGGSSGDGGSCSGGASSSSGGRGGHRSRGGHHGNSKDAFDNAGNWGDDFPAADDWDNEEYTGSLADTKVFTASGQGGKKKQTTPHPKKQSSTVSGNLSSYTSSQVAQANESSLAAGGSSQSVGQQVVPPTPLSTTVGTATSTYSQSIDLSTLLHKPTTQSSVGSNSQQQTLLQFTQQATDSLKAAVGIGQQPTVGTTVAGGSNTGTGSKTGELSYSSYASASAASTSGGSSGNNPASGYGQGNSAFTSIKPSQQQGGASKQQQQQQGASSGSAVAAAAAHHRSRLPPPSKIPNSAVEMPGDQLGGLDVQFGGLDLQFVGGGASSANSDSVNSFEFNGTGTVSGTAGTGPSTAGKDVENAYLSGDKSKVVTGQSASTSGSVKEVKSLSNSMGTGKLSSNDGYGNNPEGRKSGSGNNPSNATSYSSSRCVDMSVTKQNDSMTGYHGTTQSSYSNYGGHSKSTYHHQTSGYGSNQNNPYSGHHSYGGGNHQGSYGQSYSVSSTGVPSSNYGGNKASSNYPSNDAMVKGNFSNDQSIVNNAAAVLGLTSTTNALTGKVSATTASKVSVPNLPPGVANMLPQHYMAAAGLPAAAAFYGLQQPAAAMYSACTGLEDLAALQRASGLPALQPGYYDPNSQYAATSLAAAAAGNRDGSTNLSSLGSASVLTTSASSGSGGSVSNTGSTNTMSSSHNSIAGVGTNDKSVFGNVSANDSTSSPIPSSTHQQTLQQNAAATPATLNFAATNAFAAQHQQATLPPGYAYFYGQVPGLQAAYGGAGVYPATAMAVPTAAGGTNSTQFQKSAYGTSYGPGYDTLSQQGNKDYSHSYSGGSAVSGKSSGAGGNAGGAGHQYWGNNLW